MTTFNPTSAIMKFQAETLQPLIRETAPGGDYPIDALGPLKPAVMAVQGATGAPVAIPAQTALAVASLAVQGFADVENLAGGDGASTLYGKRAALHLMVQPEIARDLLGDALASGIGFLPRCLICEPASTIGARLSGTLVNNRPPIDAFADHLRDILARDMPMNDNRELTPRNVPLSRPARKLLIDFSDYVEREQAEVGEYETIRGYASKAAEQAARIAGVLTLWADLDAPDISPETMADAIELAQFYLSEALRLANAAVIPPEIAKAETLRKWLLDKHPEPDLIPADVTQFGPSCLRNTKDAKAAIKMLVDHGWLVALDQGTVVRDKARREAYRVIRG